MSGLEHMLNDIVQVIDFSYGHDCVGSMMGTNDQRLRFVVRNASDSHRSMHDIDIFIKFCTERGIFNIVDRPVETVLFVVDGHTGTSGSQM